MTRQDLPHIMISSYYIAATENATPAPVKGAKRDQARQDCSMHCKGQHTYMKGRRGEGQARQLCSAGQTEDLTVEPAMLAASLSRALAQQSSTHLPPIVLGGTRLSRANVQCRTNSRHDR